MNNPRKHRTTYRLSSSHPELYSIRKKLKYGKTITLDVPAEFTFNRDGNKQIQQVVGWFDWSISNAKVEIDFSKCSSANYQATALLVMYCWHLKRNNCLVSFKHENNDLLNGSRVWHLMGAQALFSVSTDPNSQFPSNEHKPLYAIRNSSDFKEALKKVEEFTSQFGVEYQQTLRYIMSELLYNVMEHGSSDFTWRGKRYPCPGIIQFTWYEKVNEIHFIVADNGVGIRTHLSQTYQNIKSDQDAIRLSIQPQVSGTFASQNPYESKNNAGMGLYISSNIAKKLRGELHIVSGDGVIHISPTDITSQNVIHGWPGTFVLLSIRVDRGTIFALDQMMGEFRQRAQEEIRRRKEHDNNESHVISAYNFFGSRAEVKEEAISYRDKYIIPAIKSGKSIVFDFSDVKSSTHSFLNALLATPIKILGMHSYKRLKFTNCTNEIRQTVDYILDDNTE